MFKNYVTIALRNFLRSKLFTIINIAGLSIGLTCCMLIMLYVKDELSYDRFHNKASRIYQVITSLYNSAEGEAHKMDITSYPVGPAIKSEIPGVEDYLRIGNGSATIQSNHGAILENISFCDNNFFSVFSFPLIHGSASTALSGINEVVLTKEKAEKYFGTSSVIGRQLSMKVHDDFENFNITGVVENPPENSSIQFDFILPFEYEKARMRKEWIGFYLNTFLVLQPHVNPKLIESRIPKLVEKYVGQKLREHDKKTNSKTSLKFLLLELNKVHLDKSLQVSSLAKKSDPVYSYILSGIAIFILFISCINFVNLSIGLSLKRAKEIGIRKVIGGLQKQLLWQFICESFLLCSFSFIVALFLVKQALPLFNQLSNKQLSLSYIWGDYRLIIFSVILLLITSVAAGFYPALVVSRLKPVVVLYSKLQFGAKQLLSRYLIVAQFGIAIFLVTVTLVFQSQFDFLVTNNLGYNDKNVIRVTLPYEVNSIASVFKTELLKNNAILQVTNRSNGLMVTGVEADGKKFATAVSRIDENYIPSLQIPLVKGRNFFVTGSDTSVAAIINETFAREAGWKDPIGKKIVVGDDNANMMVVGMVRDFNYQSLREKIQPLVLHCGAAGQALNETLIKVGPDNISKTLGFIENSFKKLSVFNPYQYDFLEQTNAHQYENEKKWKEMIFYASLVAIIISCLGLFGLTTLSVIRRTKEIGIRKVMGATVNEITTLVAGEFLKLVIISFVISIPFAFYFSFRWLENFAYRVTIQWWLFVLAGLVAIVLAMLTVCIQAIKAAMANPVKSLRTE